MKKVTLATLTLLTLSAAMAATSLSAHAEDENAERVKILGLQFGCSASYPSGHAEIRFLTESKDGNRKVTETLEIDDQDQLVVNNAERESLLVGRIEAGAKQKIQRACDQNRNDVANIRYEIFKDLKIYRASEASSERIEGRRDCAGATIGIVMGLPSWMAHAGGCKYYPSHDVPRTNNYDIFVRGQNRLDRRNYGFATRKLTVRQQTSMLEVSAEDEASANSAL